MTTHRTEFTLLCLLFAVALLLRLGAVTYGIPQSFFGDELVHVAAAFSMIGEKAARPNFPFYYLPPLLAYLLAPFFLLYGVGAIAFGFFPGIGAFKEFVLLHREYFLVFSRAISAAFGAATVIVLYYMGKAMFGRAAAFLAAAFLTFDLMHIHESQIGRIWAPTAFFFVWALYALWKWSERGEKKWAMHSALAIGLGYGMGYVPIVLLVLFLFVQIVFWKRGTQPFFAKSFVCGALVIIFCIGVFSVANTYGFWRQFGGSLATIGNGLHLTIAETPAGTSSENNFFANLAAVLIELWRDNPFLLVLGMSGAALLFFRERFSFSFVSLVLFSAFYVFFLSAVSTNMDGRYLLPIFPSLFLLAGFFVLALSERIAYSPLQLALPAFVAGAVLLYGAYGVWRYEALLQKPDTRSQAIHWVNQNVPEHARVALDDYTVFLSTDKQGIALVERYRPERLDTRLRLLKNLDDARYPRPSYTVFDVSRVGNDSRALVDFSPDYLIYSFWTQDERRAKEKKYGVWNQKHLVAFFSPRKDGKEAGDDLLGDPMQAYQLLPSLQAFGPSVAVYRIR